MNDYLMHYARGQTAKRHKYIRKEGTRYIYKKNSWDDNTTTWGDNTTTWDDNNTTWDDFDKRVSDVRVNVERNYNKLEQRIQNAIDSDLKLVKDASVILGRRLLHNTLAAAYRTPMTRLGNSVRNTIDNVKKAIKKCFKS